MKNDSLITKLKVLIISAVLVTLIVYLYFMDKEEVWDIERIITCVVTSIFTFFFPPMVKYIINWFKTLSVEESVYAGYKLGYYGIGFLILIDPIVGIMYYFNKRFKKNINGGSNIIIVGFYIM